MNQEDCYIGECNIGKPIDGNKERKIIEEINLILYKEGASAKEASKILTKAEKIFHSNSWHTVQM
ncbi:hypothetical protein [Carnobacterium maltaromaticum]|uniref:hypothetical protein n=1 Tax=Carnobacterium maltaromaticum TaxID=2751 RepID=UPI000556DA8F|nr:hypothetical protein [Carnobacterium maltaromaticum]KRN62744.1 hypothetical protein IV70_GL003451 [Carnobacterium maltaromaticum DSM 20342]